MRHPQALLIGTLVALTAQAVAQDEEQRFSTAELQAAQLARFKEDTFDSLSKYGGDQDAAAILVNCTASFHSINRNNVRCYLADANHSKRFITEVQRIGDKANFSQATVADNPERSTLYFRVLLTRDSSGANIHYFENWGHDAERYGYSYQAPQKLRSRKLTGEKPSCGSASFIATVTIGVDGVAHDDVEFETVRVAPSESCRAYARNELLNSPYIPGRLNNEVIEARLVNRWGF